MPNIARMSATAMREAIASGELSVRDVASACLASVRETEGQVRAWSYLDEALIMNEAARLDGMKDRGPLHGIPIGIKDVILTRDMPTQYNSRAYKGHWPQVDAACVATLRAAGALIFGKCDTVEFAAMGERARTRNPHDTDRTPGGSSSGSAAAVAAFHVPLSLGTQTGGSMIRPASFTGVHAIKPTWSVVSREGLKLYSATLDTLGWYGRSIEDLELLADVFAIADDDKLEKSEGQPKLAFCRSPSWGEAEPEMVAAFDAAIEVIRSSGVAVDEIAFPDAFSDLVKAQDIVMRVEGQAAFLNEFREHGDLISAEFHKRLHEDMLYTKGDLRWAYDHAARARAYFEAMAAPYHAILTPSAAGTATLGLASTGSANFNRMWTLLHVPCVNVPLPVQSGSLPLGMTATGPRFSDRRVLKVAAGMQTLLASARPNSLVA